jgi:hypothetical protein
MAADIMKDPVCTMGQRRIGINPEELEGSRQLLLFFCKHL